MATQIGELKYSVGFDVKKQDLNTLKASLQQIKKLSISDLMKINQSDRNTAIQTFSQIRTQAENVQKAIKDAFNVKLNTVNIESFNKSLEGSNTSIQRIYQTFKQAGTAGQNAFRSLSSQVLTTNVQLKQTHKFLDNIATTLANTVKWNIASGAVNALSNSVQQAWGYVKSLDTSLNDIRVVTGKSADEMANFAVQANEAAKSLGKTTVDYTKAALIYAQQGLNDEEIAARAAITLKTANVTGQSTAQVSEELTSVWNGYKVNAEQAELYIDRLAAVAASTASDLEELSTGMSKVAAAAAAMGVGEDQLAAQLSTIISVTRQAPESVGTALRTIYARISDIKAGIDEDGVTLGNYSGKMAALGFNVLDVNGKLRDMGQVIEDIGGRWQTLTREQQVSLAQTMAGQRQYSNLIALFDNFQEYNRALGIAQNAAGTLQKQQDIYMQSTAAHLNQLKTATEDLYDSLINPDSLQPLIDGLSSVINLAAKFVDSIGGGGALLTSLGAIGISVFSDQIARGLNTTITNFEIAKRNAQQFDDVLQTIQQWKGIEGLDQSTKSLLQSRQQILNLSKLMTPEQFSGMQGLLNDITETGNRLAVIKDQKGIFNNALGQISGLKKQWTSLNNVLKDADAQEKITNILSREGTVFTNLSEKLKEYGNTFRQSIGSNEFPESFTKLQSNLQLYINQAVKLSETNQAFKTHTGQINKLKQEYDNLKNVSPQQLPKKLNEITASLSGIFAGAGNAASNLRERLKEEFGETIKSLAHNEKQAEDILNKLVKSFQDSQKEIERTAKIKGVTDLVGSFSRLGASINQIQNLGSIWRNEDLDQGEKILQTVTNLGMSLPMLISGAKQAGQALSAMFSVSAGLSGGIIAGLTVLIGVVATVVRGANEANQALIKLHQTEIDQQNQKQEQIQNNKKLYSSIQDLNEKYKQGQINRIELKSAVEDLIDQYGLQGVSVKDLTKDYDNLTEAIKRRREAELQQGLTSAEKEANAARGEVLATARGGVLDRGYQSGDRFIYDFGSATGLGGQAGRIQKIFETIGGLKQTEDGYLQLNVRMNAQDIQKQYDDIQAAIDKIWNSGFSESQLANNRLLKLANQFLDQMAQSVDHLKNSQQDRLKYQSELNILQATELSDVKTTNDYIIQRKNIIDAIQKTLDEKGDKTSNAQQMADQYLRNNYRKLFVQFNEGSVYIEKVRQKLKGSNEAVEDLISKMDSQHLGKLISIVNLDNIDTWDQLEEKIRNISQMDLSNIESVIGTGEIRGAKESAADRYTFFQSLEDQVKSGKSISSKQVERISTQAPQLQSYFTMMANGQYRMTEDAKQFYNAIDSLKVQGFHDIIAQINNEIARTQNLMANRDSFNLQTLQKNNYTTGNKYVTDQDNNLIPQKNRNLQKYIDLNSEVIEQQIRFLKTVKSTDDNFNKYLAEWEETLNNEKTTVQSKEQAAINISNAVTEELGRQVYTIEELNQELKQAQQALYDALFPTDIDVDESALAQLSTTLQQLATKSDELAPSLSQNARAANEIAQAILRFDDAIQDVVDHYDDWLLALSQQSLALGDQAVLLPQLRDAYADMLDLDGSLLSDEFLLSTQHLEWMKAAIDGDIQAYDNLAEAARVAAIQALKLDPSIDMTHFEEDIAYLKSYLNNRQNFPTLEIGAELNDQKFLEELGNMLNTMGVTAKQASDILRENLGIDAEVIEQKVESQETQRQVGFNANFSPVTADFLAPVIKGGKVSYYDGTYTAQDLTYQPQVETVTTAKENSAFTLKVTSAHKSAGGNFKYTHASRGAGGAGVKRRTQAAAKAAKAAKTSTPKPDTSTKETKKAVEDDRDIYREINFELDQISRQLSRIQKKQQRLFGKQLIDNLNQQSKILDQHRYKLKEKQKLQQADLAHRREQLRLLGLIVNEQTGDIENYLDALGQRQGVINGLINQYNAVVGSYNATTDKQAKDVIKDQLTEIERAIKDAETEYKKVQSEIKEYDSIRKSFEDITDQLEEQLQKQVEINITKFKMAVEIRLQMGEAERDWNKFRREVLEGQALELGGLLKETEFNTLLKDITQNNKDIQSYFSIHGNERGQLASLTDQVNNTIAEIEKMQNGQQSVYYDNMAQAMEDLANYSSKLQDSMMNVKDLIDQVDEAYLDMYDNIKDQIDEQLDDYEFLNDLIEHDMDLLQLLYGDQQYAAMNSYYEAQYNNQTSQIAFLRQAIALVKERWQLEEAAGNTEAAKKLKDQYKDLVADLNSLVEASVKTLRDQYINAINEIFDTLDKRVSGGLGTDYLQMEWELINKNADQYLDTINSAYAIQELERKYQKAINDNQTSVKNQKILTDLMNQQLNNLRAKGKLTQYDVDRAEKLLNIEQARMALEDQRSAKTSLRLKRDSQGNYSYVYTANQEEVSAAEEALAKAQNDLYNFDKDAYRKNLDDMLSAWRDFQSQYKDIVLDTSLTEEERVEKLALLRDQYGEYINNKVAENEVIRTNLMESAFINYTDLYNQDDDSYIAMIEGEKNALMDQLVPQWDIGVQQMIDKFAAQGGFLPVCRDTFTELESKAGEFQAKITELQSTAGEDFRRLREGALSPTATSFQEIIDKNDDLINKIRNEEIPAIEGLRGELQSLLDKYKEVWDAADKASQKAHDTIQELNNAAALVAEQTKITFPQTPEPPAQSLPAAPTPVTPTTTYTPPTTTSSGTSDNTPQVPQIKEEKVVQDLWKGYDSTVKGIVGNIWYGGAWQEFLNSGNLRQAIGNVFGNWDSQGNSKDNFKKAKSVWNNVNELWEKVKGSSSAPPKGLDYLNEYDYYKLLNKMYGTGTSGISSFYERFIAFDKGGYTGSWGSEGRLAMLHQKELVLNAQDTKNMLDSVSILRNVVSSIGGSISSKLRSLSGGYIMPVQPKPADELQQSVNIQASFPNVNSKREIEEAFSELVNMAAQRAMRRI